MLSLGLEPSGDNFSTMDLNLPPCSAIWFTKSSEQSLLPYPENEATQRSLTLTFLSKLTA